MSKLDFTRHGQGLKFFGGTELERQDYLDALDWEAEHPEDRIVVLSDLWIDQPAHMTRLEAILSGESLSVLGSRSVRSSSLLLLVFWQYCL